MRPPEWERTTEPQEESLGGRIARILADVTPGEQDTRAAASHIATVSARYEDLLRSTVDWLWETDANLALSFVSSPVALKLGLPAQVLIGRPLTSLGEFTPGGGPEQQAEAAIRTHRPFRLAAFAMTGSGNRRATYHLSGVPYFDDENGQFAGYRGTAVLAPPPKPEVIADNELRALADALEEALLRQQQLSAELAARPAEAEAAPQGEVSLAKTAHELRTPLNAIIGYSDLALSGVYGPLGDRYTECLRTIREAGQHLDRLVVQMHETAKSADGRSLESQTIDVAELVAKAKALVVLQAQDADIDLSRVGPMAAGQVTGDPLACTQILVNLLTNAIKFTPAGGSVGLETQTGPNGKLQIVVWDTGVGIQPDEQAKIFASSYRVQPAAGAHTAPGHGFGLAISRDLARAMGGDLTVSSQPGQGSRFILSLPLAG
jgi:signal transduction histidine kinase